MYSQATQDGCSLALCNPLLNQRLLYLYPTHMFGLSIYLPRTPASDCFYQRSHEGPAPLLVSLVTNEPT